EFSAEPLRKALGLLEQAVALDSNFSMAHGYIANCCWLLIEHGYEPVEKLAPRGLLASRRAVETGRDDPAALARGGLGIAYFGGNAEEGLAQTERALALNPNFLLGWRFGGWVQVIAGHYEKGMNYFRRAMELGPMGPMLDDSYAGIAFALFFLGRYDEAGLWAG